MQGMDKKDERLFASELKSSLMRAGDRVVRSGTRDRAVYFVIHGQFLAIDDGFP